MRFSNLLPPLAALLGVASAVYRDEVGIIDFHHELLGLPQQSTTFFHRPRRDDRASLLYTLSDLGVLGAVNPSSGALLWRQFLAGDNDTLAAEPSFLRAGEAEGWVCAAQGPSVHAWNALTGRNVWWADFSGRVKDVAIMELTGEGRKDVLALFEEEGVTTLRRLHGGDGSVVWGFRETVKDIPLQVSTNVERVFVVSLHGSPASYAIKVTVLDPRTGKRADEMLLGTKGDVHGAADVMFVGANSATPILAWTDSSFAKLKMNVLGTKTKQEFPLASGTIGVQIHAPHLIQSEPHFLVHSRTAKGNRADVYHVDLKSNNIARAYELPLLPGHGAFSTSSEGANVWFTRVTEEEIILLGSTSHGVLARWPLKTTADHQALSGAVHAVSEVVKKGDDSYAVRAAAVTADQDWAMVRGGEVAWSRPEGLSGAVAAAWAEVPESEALARTLEVEAHISPWAAYVHRVKRHVEDLKLLPDYMRSIPGRLWTSLIGKEDAESGTLAKDSFGFNKLAVLATRRGRMYALNTGHHGKALWATQAFVLAPGETWDVKGMFVEDAKGHVTVRGSRGEYVIVKIESGDVVERMQPGTWPAVQSAAVVDSASGRWLMPIGEGGQVGGVPALWAPTDTVVVRGEHGELKGLHFVPGKEAGMVVDEALWTYTPPKGYAIVETATRPAHDRVASIGRVLGNRQVMYKYLNAHAMVVASANAQTSTLMIDLLDMVSGEILSAAVYQGVDALQGVSCAAAENWYVCAFFGAYALGPEAATPGQTLKGFQAVVTDLFESADANDRGPLDGAANFSSLSPVDRPGGAPLPFAQSAAYVLGAKISRLAVTQTRQGIATKQVLAYLPETHGVVGIPKQVFDSRRPVGRDPSAAEMEAEGLMRYHPVVEIDVRSVVSHEREVLGVKEILTNPTIVESTSLVLAYGVDVFGTRVAPSGTFDILGKGFGKMSLVGTVLALAAGVMVLGPMVRKKQTDMRWKAPM